MLVPSLCTSYMYAQCIYPKSHKLINKKTFIPAAQRFSGWKLEYALSGNREKGEESNSTYTTNYVQYMENAVEHTFSGLLFFFFLFYLLIL